jgi:hypothetical protein
MSTLVCRLKGFIQPFERVLALQELAALAGTEPFPINGDIQEASLFQVSRPRYWRHMANELAYWEELDTNKPLITHQLMIESGFMIARNGVLLSELREIIRDKTGFKKPNRRCLRYATHGIHEYRGKFFPQLVRSLINIAQVPKDGIIVDPMCGSGTTIVEGILSGRTTYGVDLNPLSVFVSETKCDLLRIKGSTLTKEYNSLDERLAKFCRIKNVNRQDNFSDHDNGYLVNWFASHTLSELAIIRYAIMKCDNQTVQKFFLVVLSNILRSVSWQKEDDLRVRRENKDIQPGEAIVRFREELLRTTKLVAAFLYQNEGRPVGKNKIENIDAREFSNILYKAQEKADVIITSPPYATALPYLDTDRLSLIYLGLLPRHAHRSHDQQMIGNREITERQRLALWDQFIIHQKLLPKEVVALIHQIENLNSKSNVGFRRKNTGALLAKYFLDMRQVISSGSDALRAGGKFFMVVGNNSTTAGNKKIEIMTAKYLAKIGEMIGLDHDSSVNMDMLSSRDIFRKNAMRSEEIICLRKS